ncbi:trihelix transcription factor PTL-like [Actinidia eriantha]|uniref:trihelix transcription factor PTL-like n=1 Tax=Actinidia eriantha TaxID=165200 RepID=UPI00258B62C1|nr:trihelix transcription factor PTL-like [Actinidia eriantha]
MDDQYGIADLRQYMNGRTNFPGIAPPGDLFSGQRNLSPYEMVMAAGADVTPRGLVHYEFRSDGAAAAASSGSLNNGLEVEGGCGGGGGGDGWTGRWPRQETLTLLEIRSSLDCKFKEANQKGPLWDEVSRIMCDEHGYQRSGKKCREKFENLYKYYKKTKEGKAGRQDGKHYRFFRQLEALYGDSNLHQASASETHLIGNNFQFHNSGNSYAQRLNTECFQAPKLSDNSLSVSHSSELETSSSDDHDDTVKKKGRGRGRRSWKSKIRDFIDLQMRKLMKKQEEWLEKMIKTLERTEQEREMREEEWRKREAERVEREHKFWVSERAWIEARDAALFEALHKLTEKDQAMKGSEPQRIENGSEILSNAWRGESWPESEITKLIELRASMETRFEQGGGSEEVLWEEIGAKMGCLGYERSGLMCKDRWERINNYLRNKKRKENSVRGSNCYFENNESAVGYNHGDAAAYCEIMNEQRASESCFRFLGGGDGENMWENYGFKQSKGENR